MSDDIDLNADVASPDARAETGDDAVITDALVTVLAMDVVGNPASAPGAHLVEDFLEDDDTSAGKKNVVEGADPHARYCFPWEGRREFLISDLVWGKVKFHPWWPGQIFDPSCASELVSWHHRKGNFLVAYFGDKTFAWCDSSQLKHLPLEFSAMEKQSSSEAFVEAVECALDEVSRRVELGLVCGCIPEEVHSRLKFLPVENAGIQEGVSLSVMDWTFGTASFRPDEFLGYIRSLAVSPICGADRFGLTVARAQLLAYNRSKGFTSLPDIFIGKGLAEESSEMPPSMVVAEPSTPVVVADERLSALFSMKTHQKSGPSSHLKRKRGSEESRKSRRLSELMEYSEEGNLESACEMGSHKKLQTTSSVKENSDKGKKRKLDQAGVQETKSSLQVPVRSFKVGECIRRVASKLTSSPSFKSNGVLQKCKERDDHENDSPFSLDDTVQSQDELHNMDVSIPTGSSLGELLCDLCIAARDPMEITDFSSTVIGFFTGFSRFRAANLGNSMCSPDEKMDEQRQILGSVSGEDTKAPEERRRRRKHISLSVSDGDRKESEEVKRKRGRPRLNSEGDAKQAGEGQRRRGRPHSTLTEAVESPEEVPRKRGQPRLSSTEQNNPSDEVPRKRGRPRLKYTTDIKSGEAVEHKQSKPQPGSPVNMVVPEVVKRRRGRPPNSSKVVVKASGTLTNENIGGSTIPEMDLSKTTPAYMSDSYWTDVAICNSPEKKPLVSGGKKRGRKRKQYLISSLDCAEKTSGEVTEYLPPTMVVESLKQIQLPSLSPNTSGSLMPERRISYFGEKCIEESNPTAFILNFMDANSLPSETELVRIFSRYGPLKDAETEIQRPLSFAKVVFKRRVDAEVAFLNARRYNFFGHSLLSFRLRSFPLMHENSINSSVEGKIDQTVASSSSFSLSGHKSGEALVNDGIQKAEVSESDEVLLNHAIDVLEERITGVVDRSPVDVLDAEKGKTVVDSVYLDGNRMVVGQGDPEVADRKERLISVNASLVDEEGLELDEKPVGDASFVPIHGQKSVETFRGEIILEDQSNGRDKTCIMGNNNIVPGREEYLNFGADFYSEIQGTERVEVCVDCGSIESQGVKGVGILECNGTGNKDFTVAVEDKTSEHFSALGELHGAEVEALRAIDNVVIQDMRSIESLVGDAKSVVSGTERLVVVADDLEVERMEVQAGSGACSVILHVNQEHQLKVKAGNVEFLCNIEEAPTQAPEMSPCLDGDNIGVPETLELPCSQEKCEILEDAKESSTPNVRSEGCHGKSIIEIPVHCPVSEVSGTCGNGTTVASASVVSRSLKDEASIYEFCLEVQCTSDSDVVGDKSNAEVVVEDDRVIEDRNMECPSINKASESVEIHASEAPWNDGTLDEYSYGSKIPEAEVSTAPACEKHVEDSVIFNDVPIDGKMLDSSRLGVLELSGAVNLETIAMTNECLEISVFKVDNVQVRDEIMGVSDGRMNEIVDDTSIDDPQCVKVLESSIVEIDMSAHHRGRVEGNGDVGVISKSLNTMASGCVIDGALACIMDDMVVNDGVRRVLGTRRMSETADAARSGLHGYGNDESCKFKKHPDAVIPKTDVHMGTGMMEARYAKPATIEVLEGMNDSDANHCIMEVSYARRGVTSVSSVNQITNGHGDLDVGEIKECSISVYAHLGDEQGHEVDESPAGEYAPLGDEQGHEVDESPAGNTTFVDSRDPKRGEAPHKMATIKDQSNERDEIGLRGNGSVAGREYDFAFGDESEVAIQGNKGVEACLDGGSVGSQGISDVEILENNDTVEKEDPAVPLDTDGISFCLAKLDETTGSNCALGELDGAEAESSKEVINMVLLEARKTESLVGDAKLSAFSAKRFEMNSDDLEARMGVQAGSDACCVVVQSNQEHELKVSGVNVEVPRYGEDEEIQTPEMSKCPATGNLGVIISETREMPREQISCEVPKVAKESSALDMQDGERCQGKNSDEMPMDCCTLDVLGTDGKGTIFASSLVETESSVNGTSVGAFCVNVMYGDGSNAKVVVNDGMIIEDRTAECPSIIKSLVSDNIHGSEALANKVASDVYRCGSKSLEAEVPAAPEKHMGNSVIADDAPIKGKMVDSGIRAHVEAAYTGANNIIGTAILKAHDCCRFSVSVPSDLEVLFCTKDDELVNGGQLESAEVTEVAGKFDSYAHASGLMPEPVSSNYKTEVHMVGGNLDIVDGRTDGTVAENAKHSHGGLLPMPACRPSDADLEGGTTKLNYTGV